MVIPTKAEYDVAKQHQAQHPGEWAPTDPISGKAVEPSAEVLAHVAMINAYERAQDQGE